MGNDVLLIKMRFGILGVDLAQVWNLILDVGSRLDLGMACMSLTETPWSRCDAIFDSFGSLM